MGFVDDHGKMLLLQVMDGVDDIRELLNRRGDDLRIALQGPGQVLRVACIVHDANQASLVFQAPDSVLQLPVDDDAVRDDDDIIEDDVIVGVVEGRQTMSQPGNGIRLPGASRVLDQIVLRRAVDGDVSENLADGVELMIARENQGFPALRLARQVVLLFLHFEEHELADQFQHGILSQDVFPHVGNTVLVRVNGIALAGVDARAVALIERQEEGVRPGEFRRHVDFVEVHSEIDEDTGLKAKEPRLRAAFGPVLIDSIVDGLPGGIALEFKAHDGQTVEENDEVDAFFVAGPDLFHDGKDILLVLPGQFRIEVRCRFGVHQIEVFIGNFEAVFQDLQAAAAGFRFFRIQKADDGLFQFAFVDFRQLFHLLRLRRPEETEKQFPVNGMEAVVLRRLADDIAVVLGQVVHDEMLVFFFRFNGGLMDQFCHDEGTSFLPVTYS